MAIIVHVVPPLRFAAEGVAIMRAAIAAGMPLQICSAGQAGATSPAPLAGALAQGLAEYLAGMMVVDALGPGHPCIYAFMPFISDLRTGAMSGGGGEAAVNALRRIAAFQNPNFYEKQRLRLPTARIPRIICRAENFPRHVALPRGCVDDPTALLHPLGATLEIDDQREDGHPIEHRFHGTSTELQEQAVRVLRAHDIGVLVAPPGVGKTIAGIRMISERARQERPASGCTTNPRPRAASIGLITTSRQTKRIFRCKSTVCILPSSPSPDRAILSLPQFGFSPPFPRANTRSSVSDLHNFTLQTNSRNMRDSYFKDQRDQENRSANIRDGGQYPDRLHSARFSADAGREAEDEGLRQRSLDARNPAGEETGLAAGFDPIRVCIPQA